MAIALVGLTVPHLLWAPASPIDNFKFFTLAALALGLLAAPLVDGLRARLSGIARPLVVGGLVAASIATPLLYTAARVITAPTYLMALAAGGPASGLRVQPLLPELYPAEHEVTRRLRRTMGPRDLLLLLPRRPMEGEAGAVDIHVHAMAGRFLAAPKHLGYPGIVVPREILSERERLYLEALALDPRGLEGLAPLWIYVREPLVPAEALPAVRRGLRRAVRLGLIQEAFSLQEPDGRHLVYQVRAAQSRSAASDE